MENCFNFKGNLSLLTDFYELTMENSYLNNNLSSKVVCFDVFFRKVHDGPIGSLEVKVTAGRSIATDDKIFPKAALGFIKLDLPTFDENGKQTGTKKIARFVLNQDTGGAIKGPGRADLFLGAGNQAELEAGHLKSNGDLFFLLKKSAE